MRTLQINNTKRTFNANCSLETGVVVAALLRGKWGDRRMLGWGVVRTVNSLASNFGSISEACVQ